jgi:hypothetical protein
MRGYVMRYFVVIVFLIVGISALVMANDVGPVTSLKEIIFEKNQIIVTAGSYDERKLAADKLDQLWEKTPTGWVGNYKRPWKAVRLSLLEAIFGPIPRRYVIVGADVLDYYACPGPSLCTPKMGPFRVYETEVKRAALFEWCGGEIVPVLDLGVWPWGKVEEYPANQPPAVAMSLTPYELPVIGSLDISSVPQELAANFSDRATGITLRLPKLGKQFALTYYRSSASEYDIFNVIQKSATGKDKIVEEQEVVGRC